MKGRKAKAAGGKVMTYSGADSNVAKVAKSGGMPGKVTGAKRGGKMGKMPIMLEGATPKHHRLDRPGRKSGGAVGADTKPLTTAARLHGGMKKGGRAC